MAVMRRPGLERGDQEGTADGGRRGYRIVCQQELAPFPFKEDTDGDKYPATSSQNTYAFYLTKSSGDNFMKIFDEEKKEDNKKK